MDAIKALAALFNRSRRAALAVVATTLLLFLNGCQPAPRGPAIWRLTDADSEIWLFGTVHILPPDLQWRTERINRAFSGADMVVFETDVSREGGAELATLLEEHGYNRAGPPLTTRLPTIERERLSRVTRKLGLTSGALEELDKMRPWFAALQLTFLFVQSTGQESAAGVDAVLDAEAERLNKQRGYLETPEQQIRFLADLPADVEIKFLIATLRQLEEEENSLAQLDNAWVRGDTRTLARLLNGLVEEAGPEVYRALIIDRNSRWTVEIERMLAGQDDIFIAVGAAHLVGRSSVIAQLRARGHRVEGP